MLRVVVLAEESKGRWVKLMSKSLYGVVVLVLVEEEYAFGELVHDPGDTFQLPLLSDLAMLLIDCP